jgi:putative Holliday junction resolvase
MSRWLGIDHGTRRIGAALGDTDSRFASPLEAFSADDPALMRKFLALAERYGAAGVVVGWPLNDDGSEGPQAVLTRQFALELSRATGLDVRLWDETLSSFEADEKLKGLHTRAGKRLRHDAVAAAAFLNDFLAADGPARAPKPDGIGQRPKAEGRRNRPEAEGQGPT